MADRSAPQPSNLSQLDLDSIEQFVCGKKKSIAGASLRIEYADNSIKLINAQEVIIAINKQVSEWQQNILIYRYAGEYFDVLENCIIAKNFFSAKKSHHPDFVEYNKYQVPNGYILKNQSASLLSHAWLTRHSRVTGNHSQSPLVFQGNNWYPIQELKIDRNIMYLRTLVGEMSIDTNDLVIWIEPMPTDPDSASVEPAAEPDKILSPAISSKKPAMKQQKTPSPLDFSDSLQTAELTAAWKTPILTNPPSTQSQEITNLKQTLKLKALGRMVDYLNEGEVIVSTEVLKNANNQVVSTKITEVKRHCPRWVIEQVRKF
jgi:hypothetical protein